MIKLILYGLVLYFIYRLLKSKGVSWLQSKGEEGLEESASSRDTELIQDPQCGAYFLKQKGVEAKVEGKSLHFCSEACRNAYIERRRSG